MSTLHPIVSSVSENSRWMLRWTFWVSDCWVEELDVEL